MGLASDMKRITENISDAHDLRLKAAGERAAQTRDLLKDSRKRLADFASDRKRAGAEQLKSLGEFVTTLKANVEGLRDDAANMRKNFQKEHKARAAALRETLDAHRAERAQHETARTKNFESTMNDIRSVVKGVEKAVADIKDGVAGKLSEFSGDRKNMNQELRKELSKYADNISHETSKMLSDARVMVSAFAEDRREMSANWRGMASATPARHRAAERREAAETAESVEMRETKDNAEKSAELFEMRQVKDTAAKFRKKQKKTKVRR